MEAESMVGGVVTSDFPSTLTIWVAKERTQ